MRRLLSAGFIGAVAFGASAAIPTPVFAGPTVTNGSFENCATSTGASATCSTTIVQDSSGYSPGAASEYLQGWSTNSTYTYLVTPSAMFTYDGVTTIALPAAGGGSNNYIYMDDFPQLSPDGGNFLIEDASYNLQTGSSSNGGTLSETVSNLVVGTNYAVTFYEALAQQYNYQGSDTGYFQVGLGTSYATSTFKNAQTETIPQGGFSGWIPQTLYFVATAAQEVLSFTGVGTGAPPFLALDGVNIAVPEPASWDLLGIALVGLVVIRQRRNAAATRR